MNLNVSKKDPETFSRTRLLIGEDCLKSLENACVLVFGVGGVGSHCIEALARAGIGRLILVDNDCVAPSNINRQSIACHSTIGQYKTQVMKARIADINPDAIVETYETFILPENLEAFFEGISGTIDYIADAIDTVAAKLAIIQYAVSRRIPIISCMGTGNKLHGELFEIADISQTSVCPLCRVMRKELKARGIFHLKVLYSREQPIKPGNPEADREEGNQKEGNKNTSRRSTPGSISFVPPVAGLLIVGEIVRELSGLS